MASINEKLNYINETKFLIKDKLNDLGSEIDNETTFRGYAEKIEDLYEKWPKINGEDIDIDLNNTKKGKIKLQLNGNTNQFTTTGKNLLNISNFYSITGVINIETIISNIPAGTYKLTCKGVTKEGTNYPSLRINNNYYALNPNTDTNITIPDELTSAYFYSNGSSWNDSQGITSIINDLMISTNGGNYEPYTGGIASPNTDYPQEIKNVTNENIIKITGSKNRYNNTDTQATQHATIVKMDKGFTFTKTAQGNADVFIATCELDLTPNTTYSMYSDLSDFYAQLYFYNDKLFGTALSRSIIDNSLSHTSYKFTTDDTGHVLIGFYAVNQAQGTSNTFNNIVLYKGNVSLSNLQKYFSYQAPILYNINLNNLELCKITNTQDYIYKNNNKWYKKPMILKIDSYNGETISTNYKSTTGSLTTGATVYYINPNNNPNGIEITDATLITQLNTLEQAMSYDNQTSIFQENNDLPFIISADVLLKNSN